MKTPLIKNRVLGNERGAMAILSVVTMSLVIVTTLSTIYVYLVNRAKYHSRIREAYQLTHVMEEFGKLTKQAHDTALSLGAGNICPGPGNRDKNYAVDNKIFGVPMCFPPCSSAFSAGTTCNAALGSLCISHLGKTYCMESSSTLVSSLDNKDTNYAFNVKEDKPVVDSTLDKWYARLDRFFESSVTEPIQMVSRGVLLPSLNIPKPSFVAWIERETHAMAKGNDEESGKDGVENNEAASASGSTSLVTEQVEVIKEDNLKSEMCDVSQSSNPNCHTANTSAGGNENNLYGGGLVGGKDGESGGIVIAPPSSGGCPTIPGGTSKDGGQTSSVSGTGTVGGTRGGGTTQCNVPPECRPGGGGGLSCLAYCHYSPQPDICAKAPSAYIVVPNCSSATHTNCIPCKGLATCFRVSFCLSSSSGGESCGKKSNTFEQLFNLIL